jgi:hypothetical protein
MVDVACCRVLKGPREVEVGTRRARLNGLKRCPQRGNPNIEVRARRAWTREEGVCVFIFIFGLGIVTHHDNFDSLLLSEENRIFFPRKN